MDWNLTEAKNRLSEVLDRADTGEAQVITRRGREFVLVRGDDYRRLTGDTPSLVDYLIDAGPRFGDDFQTMPRDAAPTRDPLADQQDEQEAA